MNFTKLIAIVCTAFCAAVLPNRAEAQVTAADSAGVLVGVARRLQSEGRTDLAVTLLRLVRDRYPDTPAAVEADRLLTEGRRAQRDESGRTELMVFGTTYGVALGVATPIAMKADDEEVYGLGLLVGAPAGFLLSRAYARSRSLSEGQASAIISGTLWGAWQAFGWGEVMDIDQREFCDNSIPPEAGGPFCYTEGPDADAVMKTMIAGSLVGVTVGALLSQKNITNGTASTVNFGALWGSWFGTAIGILADQEEDALLSAVLLGGNAGLVGGAIGNRSWQLSESRARLISIAGVGGLVAGAGLLLIFQPQGDDNSSIAVPLAGSIGGLALGAYWTRHMEREASLEIGGRKLGFAMPSVQPTWVEQNGRRRAAVRLNLIQARF